MVTELAPGVFHLAQYLAIERQRALAGQCHALLDGDVPAYVPTVRGGGSMHVRMLCLGRHWNGKTYQYEARRSDFDGKPAPALPGEFRVLANAIAAAVGMALDA
jgi:alkylated DNA repair protein (DNA oxidative demethylase)